MSTGPPSTCRLCRLHNDEDEISYILHLGIVVNWYLDWASCGWLIICVVELGNIGVMQCFLCGQSLAWVEAEQPGIVKYTRGQLLAIVRCAKAV